MKKAEVESTFQVVTSPRSGPRKSALFHHIMRTGDACIAEFVAAKKIVKIERPAPEPDSSPNSELDLSKPDAKSYVMWELDPKMLRHDLFKYLPPGVLAKYKFGKASFHVRVDRIFGTKGSKLATKLFLHSHITFSVGELAIHVYVDDDGEFVDGVFISEPDKPAYAADAQLSHLAYENSKEPQKIIKHALEHMQAERDNISKDFGRKLNQMSKLAYFSASNFDDAEMALDDLRKLNAALAGYLEDHHDNRFNLVQHSIRNWKKRGATESTAVPTVEEARVLEVTQRVEEMQLGQDTRKRTVSSLSTTSTATSLSPTKEMTEKEIRHDLHVRYNVLKGKAKKAFATAQEALTYNLERESLEIDYMAAFVNANDEKTTKLCLALEAGLPALPTLYKSFVDFALKLNVESALRLFPMVRASIPYSFYEQFLYRITQNELTPEEIKSAVELCEFFYREKDYRKLLASIPYINICYTSLDGKSLYTSLLVNLIFFQYIDLFNCLLKQTGVNEPCGYVQGEMIATLFEVACAVSDDEGCDAFVEVLLAKKPLLVTPFPFAAGIKSGMHMNDADPDARSKFTAEELSTDDKRYKVMHELLGHVPYIGSALSAYCAAGYQSSSILKRMAKDTNTLHLVLGFAHFYANYAGFVAAYSRKRFGLRAEYSAVKRQRIAADELLWSRELGANYLGLIIGNKDSICQERIDVLVKEVTTRLEKASQSEIQKLIEQLHASAETYRMRGDCQTAVVCKTAIVFLSTYLEPSVENHMAIVKTFIQTGDIIQQDPECPPAPRAVEQKVQYDLARDFAKISRFSGELLKDADIAKIYAMQEEAAQTTSKSKMTHVSD